MSEDAWAYAADAKGPWAFRPGADRVSHLSLLLYLNEEFEGGQTTRRSASPRRGDERRSSPRNRARRFFDDDGGPPVAVAPERGAALVFFQSFKLGRSRVRDSAVAPLHEGSPVLAGAPKYAIRSDVLYTFPTDGEAPAPR